MLVLLEKLLGLQHSCASSTTAPAGGSDGGCALLYGQGLDPAVRLQRNAELLARNHCKNRYLFYCIHETFMAILLFLH